jgi:glucosylceramidase
MRSLFGPNGLRLRFLRLPIAASDFTVAGVPYTYDDVPLGATDPTLADFSIAHDTAYVLPAIRQALSVNPHAFVMATPWSPPAWMKTNSRLGNPSNNPGWLRQTAYAPMAQYFVKFLQAYAQAGVHVDAITPQNEPGIHTLYPGMTMSPANEGQFVADDLVPALRAAHLNTEIYGYDSNWAPVSRWFALSVAKGPAEPYLTGMSTHCYSGEPTFMSMLHNAHPNLDEVVSECAMGVHRLGFATSEAEIASFRNWASALNLWNLALNPNGGPVQPPNDGCKSCTGLVTIAGPHSVSYTRDFYQLGQFSKYVQPGAVRIASNNFVTYTTSPTGNIATDGLDDVAFLNRDHARVLLAYNNSTAPIKFAVEDQGYFFTYKLAPGETGTFIWYSPVSGKPSHQR